MDICLEIRYNVYSNSLSEKVKVMHFTYKVTVDTEVIGQGGNCYEAFTL